MTFNPKPGDIITVENGNKFACCTYAQLTKRYKVQHDDYDIYGIACDGQTGWEAWTKYGKNDAPGYDIAAVTPAPQPEGLLPAPGETFVTAGGLKFLCVTPEDLLKTCPDAKFSERNCTTLGLLVDSDLDYLGWQGWPCPSLALKIVEILPTKPLPAESVQAIAEARQTMATGQIEAIKVYAASDCKPKFSPKPGDTIVTGDYAYVCCTKEYLLNHYGLQLEGEFTIYGYRPGPGAPGVGAVGWDAEGKSLAETFNIIRVITALGNKPKFKGITSKQTLLDHLASLDGDNIRIRINDDHSISIE